MSLITTSGVTLAAGGGGGRSGSRPFGVTGSDTERSAVVRDGGGPMVGLTIGKPAMVMGSSGTVTATYSTACSIPTVDAGEVCVPSFFSAPVGPAVVAAP